MNKLNKYDSDSSDEFDTDSELSKKDLEYDILFFTFAPCLKISCIYVVYFSR